MNTMNTPRTFTTIHGYQGFSVCVNGVTVSTLICHGDIPSGDTLEREYTIGDGVHSYWNPTENSLPLESGTQVSLRDFKEICRRHGLTFESRKI